MSYALVFCSLLCHVLQFPCPVTCHVAYSYLICHIAQVTLTNLNHTKKVLRPKVLISENVLSGTVTNTIIDQMSDLYDSEDQGVNILFL